ncbi:MAG: helix-turn-helix transcriptional regulator [Bacteroidaceae bacterium]|nr:helix-turn-helix transcriptional regulator [Bacteroidaceae bacterium]
MIHSVLTLLPMMVCLFWVVTLMCDIVMTRSYAEPTAATRGLLYSRYYLLLFLAVASVLYFGHCAYFNRLTHLTVVADSLYVAANLAVYPLYYLYICALTQRENRGRLRFWLLFPAIAGGVTVALLYAKMTDGEMRLFIERYLYRGEHPETGLAAMCQMYVHDACKLLFAVLVIVVLVLGRRDLSRYERLLNNSYADTENKSLVSLQHMLLAFVVTSVVSFMCNLVGRNHFVDSPWLLTLPSVAFSILLFIIGYVGSRTQFSIWNIEQDEQEGSFSSLSHNQAATSETNISQLCRRIEQLMNEELFYLQPNLKIGDLSARLATNRNYIYLAINREMKMSFSEYINRQRIAYAKALIDETPQMPLTEVAERSGFNSSTSFYRNFRQYQNMSPKAYQERKR